MIYLGNGLYSDPGTSLQHYGVIGMKWGIRKDKEFRSDLNRHETNNRIRDARKKYKSGKISKEEFKRINKTENQMLKAKNKAMRYDYAGMKPVKGAKVKSIYEKNMKKAKDTIPYYEAKHAARKGIKIATGAIIGATATTVGGLGGLLMSDIGPTAASDLGAGLLYLALQSGGLISNTAAQGSIGKGIVNRKM